MKIYKIRDKITGLYTNGGRYADCSFNEHGKIWFNLKTVNSFLRYFSRDQKRYLQSEIKRRNLFLKKDKKPLEEIIDKSPDSYIPDTWEVVEFEIEEIKSFSAKDHMKDSVS